MKNPLFATFLIALGLLVSCSTENKGIGTAIPKEPTADFLPLKKGNQWTFKNEVARGDSSQTLSETLRVGDSLTENETLGYLFESDQENKNQSLLTALLVNGRINNVEGRLFFNGDLVLDLPVLDSIQIPLRNLLLLNQNSEEESTLSEHQGEIETQIVLNEIPVPAKVQFDIHTELGEKLTSYKVHNQQYDNVVSAHVYLELTATAELPGNYKVNLLAEQEVLHSINYFAEEIGLIFSETEMYGEFEDLSEYDIPRSTKINGNIMQWLEDYTLE